MDEMLFKRKLMPIKLPFFDDDSDNKDLTSEELLSEEKKMQ